MPVKGFSDLSLPFRVLGVLYIIPFASAWFVTAFLFDLVAILLYLPVVLIWGSRMHQVLTTSMADTYWGFLTRAHLYYAGWTFTFYGIASFYDR